MNAEDKLTFAARQLDRISALCYIALNPEMERERVIGIVKRIHRRAMYLRMVEEDGAEAIEKK